MTGAQRQAEAQAAYDLFGFPECFICARYNGGKTCDVFREIPHNILSGESNHHEPVAGDRGIVFQKRANARTN